VLSFFVFFCRSYGLSLVSYEFTIVNWWRK